MAAPCALASADALVQFGGRLHPVVLHLPIGLLAALVLLEVFAWLRRKPLDKPLRMMLAWLTALSAAVSMTSGLLLSREDSYGGDSLQTHKLLGIALTAGLLLMAACASRSAYRHIYLVLLAACVIAMIPTGHLGGTMTHGEGFLTAPFAGASELSAPDGQRIDASANLFVSTVAPIFNEKCASCHGERRQRAGLSLHTPEGIRAGSKAGPVVVPGDPAASQVVVRLRLPVHDDAHMPPSTKPQPTEEEIASIERWIAAGAPFSGPSNASLNDPKAISPDDPPPPIQAKAPSDEALAALRAAQVHVEFVDPDKRLLWIDFAGAPAITDRDAQTLLGPLAPFITDLSLAGTQASDEVLRLAARMPHLRALDLSRTNCSSTGLHALQGHAALEELRLTQTKLGDSAIEALCSLPALKRIYLWNSGISPEAAGRLHAVNPELIVDVGVADAGGQPLETEGAIALSSEAPAPGASASVSLSPINAICPVSGASINPKFAIVHDGQVIGFCCQDCAAKFWAEPEKYPIPARP